MTQREGFQRDWIQLRRCKKKKKNEKSSSHCFPDDISSEQKRSLPLLYHLQCQGCRVSVFGLVKLARTIFFFPSPMDDFDV